MTQAEIKALAFNNVKNGITTTPQLSTVDFVYYLGLVYTYQMAKTDEAAAKEYMPTLDKLFKTELEKYPNWDKYYQSNRATVEHIEELNQLMLKCVDNADNCECCKAIKDW